MALSQLEEIFSKYGDEFTTGFPILSSPTHYLMLLCSIYATIYLIAPYFAYKLRSSDLRPIMLVADGYVLGIIGMGVLIGLVLTHGGSDSFYCPVEPIANSNDLRVLGVKLIAVSKVKKNKNINI